ncbi:MAG: NAD(P)-dependent oxidoreductase [Solirubrobacteraceae bacterium]
MRVFITGAAGFLGRALSERYVADGHEVCGMDLVPDSAHDIVAGDVAAAGPWQEHAKGCDLVIHTAAVVSLRTERPREVWEANVLGTLHALEAAERGGAQRFVHFSSVTVFGFDFPDGVDERHPVAPTGLPYPDTKIASEQVVLQAQLEGRVNATIVRPGDVYGPRSRAWALLPAQMIRDRRFVLPGGGRGIFSPVYVDNVVDGVVLAAASPEASGQVFTLSDGVGIANRDFFAPYAELIGRRLLTLPTPIARTLAAGVQRAARSRPGDNDVNPLALRYMLRSGTYSNAKARRMLDWEPRVSLEDGLVRTVDWLSTQGF